MVPTLIAMAEMGYYAWSERKVDALATKAYGLSLAGTFGEKLQQLIIFVLGCSDERVAQIRERRLLYLETLGTMHDDVISCEECADMVDAADKRQYQKHVDDSKARHSHTAELHKSVHAIISKLKSVAVAPAASAASSSAGAAVKGVVKASLPADDDDWPREKFEQFFPKGVRCNKDYVKKRWQVHFELAAGTKTSKSFAFLQYGGHLGCLRAAMALVWPEYTVRGHTCPFEY